MESTSNFTIFTAQKSIVKIINRRLSVVYFVNEKSIFIKKEIIVRQHIFHI
jgi:hypothetical protein